MKGRKPIPKALNDLRGDPGRRRRYEVEPQAPAGLPPCPTHFDSDAVAKAEWVKTVKLLDDMGLMTQADATALTLYCEAYSRYRKAAADIAKYGDVIVSPKTKYMQISPFVTILNRSLEQCHKLLSEFGLTPAARTRLSIRADSPVDEFANFLQFGNN